MTKTSAWTGFRKPVHPYANALQATDYHSCPAIMFFLLFILKTSTMKLQPYTSPYSKCKAISDENSLMAGSPTFNKATSKEMMPDGIDAKESLGWNDNLWNEDRD